MCWTFTGTERKRGDIVLEDTTIVAKDLSYKEQLDFLEKKRLEAIKDGKTLDKYLAEFTENIKLRKAALSSWSSKFELKFHKHFDGEIVSVPHNDRTIAYYRMVGAHNHEKIGEVFELIAIRKPSGVTFENLPNNTPFKGNVEMTVNGVLYEKKATSTFFPKNWDIIRVKEEIALVYDKMKASGITYNPRSTNRKYDTLNSEGTFEMRIEFDELGNLTNAYPLIN